MNLNDFLNVVKSIRRHNECCMSAGLEKIYRFVCNYYTKIVI